MLPEEISYPYEIKLDAPPEAIATVAGRAISDAPYDLSADAYPLVILSPGFIIGRTSYAWLAEHLASYGFVVIAPEHQERFDPEMSDFWQAAITRPQDIHTVIAYADEQVTTDGTLEGLINTDSVAVIGHSFGGYTSLVMAGARFDINGMEALCQSANEAGDPNAWLCGMVLPHVASMAELAGLDSVPDGLWPAWGDSRVDAIVPMAGDAYFFNEAGLAEITVPVMAIGGTSDTGTPYMWGTYPTYEHVSSQTKARVSFENAEHMIFASTCEALPWFAEIGFYEFCSDAVWDVNRAHDLVNHFTTAFLLAELNQDADAAAALMPDAVQFSGVTYESLGY
jgi:predicted dienelactone hydrolase